jgi:DNA-directed RNA polymerase subunit N (RpoN/RPB10)
MEAIKKQKCYTSGNVIDKVWREYIKNQKPEHPDYDFKLVVVA